MAFDSKRYKAEYLQTRDAKQGLPDDLLERYAVDLAASEAEVAAQVKAVRAFWNTFRPGIKSADVARLCRSADETLKAEHGDRLLQKAWWVDYANKKKEASPENVGKFAERLKSAYGSLGVVTRKALDAAAATSGASPRQMALAAQEAGLKVVPSRALPEPPVKANHFGAIEVALNACGARTIPGLLHPDSGEFRILDGYECAGDARLRLDLPAVVEQLEAVQRMSPGTANDARREALQSLKTAVESGTNLTELALAHLVDLGRGSIQHGPAATRDRLVEGLMVERGDAAVLTALLEEQEVAAGASGTAKVERLLGEARLGEARQAAESISSESQGREDLLAQIAAARARVDILRTEVRAAVQAGEEVRAAALVREMEEISAEDAEEELAAVPLAPVAGLRLGTDEGAVKLYWQRNTGHSEDTTFVVTRSDEIPPPSIADGHRVASTHELGATDDHPPVARSIHYSVFATGPGRPVSRAAAAPITILPPVGHCAHEVGTDEVTVRWSTHPAAVGVEVHRTAPGEAPVELRAEGNSCRLTGLPEGVPVHFEIAALYRDSTGSVRRSAVEHVDATPRSAARPLAKLRARPIGAGDAVRVRVSWSAIDSSEVRVFASTAPPPWSPGTRIADEQLARFGDIGSELIGRRATNGTEVTLDADLDAGVHHLFAVSIGGTGIVCGAATTVGITAPIRNPVVTPFATYATISWEWPDSAQIAEVRSEIGDEVDIIEITRAAYRAEGGAKVKLGSAPCKIEIRALIHSESGSFASPSVALQIAERNEVEISYRVSSSAFNRRSKRVTFHSKSGCSGVAVRMVVAAGSVMPLSPDENFVLLDEHLDLAPGRPAEFKATVPKSFSTPRWVRCFSLSENTRLIDPPISDLKD
jgi:hypothetical protein